MSHTNGQHDEQLSNGPSSNYQYQPVSEPGSLPVASTSPPISDFLVQLEDYTPTIPDSVTAHYLATAGLETTDPRILRLVSLAAQKFVSDVASDALTNCKMRQANATVTTTKKGGKEKKYVMTTEDLSLALGEHGVNVRKPPYYQ
eukprot:GFUD01023967.1.p1 GENE.GFUD01023967.1~~GFUD01023967.1.p1  ORF type:complete len:162 (-),score=62.73 GFUD01023967.1:166-600(-)